MKEFEQLMQKNGIKMPRTPWGRFFFEKKWEPVAIEYRKKSNQYWHTIVEWNAKYRETFSSHWGRDLKYEDKAPFDVPRFGNIQEARRAMSSIHFPLASNLYYEVEAQERRGWISSLLLEARAGGYRMVVIRGEYTPSAGGEATFREQVASGKECGISCVFCPAWVAFRADTDVSSVDFRYWLIHGNTAKVEFVK